MLEVNQDTLDLLLKNKVESAALLRTSLKCFISVFHYYIFRKQFIFKPFHDLIIKKLEDIVFDRAEKRNLYIGVCPRSGKSQIMQYFICWSYALNSSCNFIMTSYGDKLVLKFSGQSKSIIESDLYSNLFGLRCVKDTTAKDLWKIENGGEFRASSLQGTLTGFGAGLSQDEYGGALIVDDFLKADNYKSSTEKQNVIDIYTNTLKSRLNNPKTPIIIIAQRLAKDDLIGWLQENEASDWDFLIIPTLDNNDKSIWEDKFPAEKLIKMRDVNPFLFYSQYQQEPIVLGGTVIKEEWFRFYPTYNGVSFSRMFFTADTAQKVKESNDFTAIGLWGLTLKNELYLIDLLHGKWEAPDLERQFIAFWNKWRNGIGNCKPNGAYIEDKASGTGLIQSIKYKGGVPIIPYMPEKDKLTRVMDITPYIEAGMLYLPTNKEFETSKKVISESVAFTADDSHSHDDIVDCMAMALNLAFVKTPMRVSDGWEIASDEINDYY